jgi:formylglycine-generating enzyme
MSRAILVLVTFAVPLLAVVAGCSTLLGGPDLPVIEDGGGQDSTASNGGMDSGLKSTPGGDSGSNSTSDSGSTSAGDSGSTTASDSGSTSAGDSGSTSTSDSGSTSAGDSGSTTGSDSGSSGSDSGGDAGGVGVPLQSCQPGGNGLTNCGTTSESCCTSLEVTGGAYNRTYDPLVDGGVVLGTDGGATGLADPATVSGFKLDKYLVTVGRFRQFVTAWNGGSGWKPGAGTGIHTHLNGGLGLANSGMPGMFETGWIASDSANIAPTDSNLACSGFATWTSSVGGNEKLPINCINWWEAEAFCIWDGGFLPSEAEWGYVAAAGSEQREYPWGATAPGTSNQYAIYSCDYPSGSPTCMNVSNVAPVGTATLGASLWGQLDLSGNMTQWNLDWYVANYQSPCVDCAFLVHAFDFRVLRGGYWASYAAYLSSSYRNNTPPEGRYDNIGSRCARVP